MKVVSLVAASVLLSACKGVDRINSDCAGIGLSRIVPSDTTIGVGESFVARFYEGGYCAGQEATTAHLDPVAIDTWYTPDTLILRVDSETGQVTGRAIGDAELTSRQRGFLVHVLVR